MAFVRRKIDLTFILGQGAFGESGEDTLTVSGARVRCTIVKTVGPRLGEAHVRIQGLTRSIMNQLSALNRIPFFERRNRLIVKAGDDTAGMSVIFDGQIMLCQIDMGSAPDVAMNVEAFGGILERLKVREPVSYPTSADAAVILAELAYKMGMDFENGGVTGPASVQLSTPYYPGSLMEQAEAVARDANVEMFIDYGSAGRSVMVVTPKGVPRGGLIPLISASTGLVGYPSYASGFGGIAVKCLFNPYLRLMGLVSVQSDLQVANGEWLTFDISHELESEVEGGAWFTHFNGMHYVR